MATGIRIGWRKLMTLALAQITVPMIRTRRTTQKAVSAAHIILRCHGVGYSLMFVARTPQVTGLDSSLLVGRYRLAPWFFRSYLPGSCFLDRGPALFAMIPTLQNFDSI